MLFPQSNKQRRKKSKASNNLGYDHLEEKNLLTTLVAFDAATQDLGISLTAANDVAVVDVAANGNITVNGSQDLSSAAGVQSASATTLSSITITGNGGFNQQVTLAGDFSSAAGRAIDTVSATGIEDFTINGDYTLAGDLSVTAGGDIVGSAGSSIDVGGIARFSATNVVLGDSAGDTVSLNAISSTTTEDFVLAQDSTVVLLNVSARNLDVTSSGGIFDGRRTDILVTNQATFDAGTQIRIGENGSDTFNAQSVNFNANGHVNITADSDITFVGENNSASLTVLSFTEIADHDTATINVDGISHFEGTNIVIGDSVNDEFNSGSILFVTNGDLDLSENSDTHIIEGKNVARRLFLNSDGAITDDDNAEIGVQLFSRFVADSVNIGDSDTDEFNAGSIGFRTAGAFRISEDSRTNIIGDNFANSSTIVSTDEITNNFVGANGEGTSIDVITVASFEGSEIDLGDEINDSLNFGALQLNSPGVATVSEDSGTHFTRASQVGVLNLTSTGAVTDAISASLNVTGTANIEGTLVRLGENDSDEVNAGLFTFNTSGIVDVTDENGSVFNDEFVNGFSIVLVANGSTFDDLDTDDILEVGQLNFDLEGNAFISVDSDFQITDDGEDGNRLTFIANGSVIDSVTDEILAEGDVTISAIDLIIGDLAGDSFDIINGDETISVSFTGDGDAVISNG